jgi:enoyl-CoA hydratase/carnithine racemase
VATYEDIVVTGAGEVLRGPCSDVAANPPPAVQKLKDGLRRSLDPDWRELGHWVSASLHELFSTEDHREGVAAFLERRRPPYVGR